MHENRGFKKLFMAIGELTLFIGGQSDVGSLKM